MVDEVKNAPAVLTDKKALAKWRTNHDLHVLMIMNKHGLTKAQAVVQAYHEGVEGLNKRLA
nr:MAG: hypothetical protein [Microvirus sp.]